MMKRYQERVGGLFKLSDAILISAAWLASYWLRFTVPIIPVTKGFPSFETYAALLPVIIALWLLVFSALRVYRSKRMLRRTHEAQLVIKAHVTATLIFIALTYLFSDYKYSRAVLIYFLGLGGFFLVVSRLIVRNALRARIAKGRGLRNVVAMGEGPQIESLIYQVSRFPELGLKFVGIFTRETKGEFLTKSKIPVLGDYSKLALWTETNTIDEVLIALPRKHYAELDAILESIRDATFDIRLVPDVHEYVALGCEVEDFNGIPMVHINESPLSGWGALAKRFTDIVLASIALILLSPALLLLALITKFTSPGPIFYVQERMGLDGKRFRMLKFRSMREGADQGESAWTVEKDPRRTRWGTFIRATSLDELPQIWNVLRGEMSLVGPRPEQPLYVQKFRKDIPHYMLRHKVKAGITGWAQIHGWRGNTSLERRIEFDLYYIQNWSYFLDLKILLLTLWKGLINRNAY